MFLVYNDILRFPNSIVPSYLQVMINEVWIVSHALFGILQVHYSICRRKQLLSLSFIVKWIYVSIVGVGFNLDKTWRITHSVETKSSIYADV